MHSALRGIGDTSADGYGRQVKSLFVFMRMKNHVLEGCKTLFTKAAYVILPPVHVKKRKINQEMLRFLKNNSVHLPIVGIGLIETYV